ncbi:uncharacterized protein BDZ99DRAFT_437244 [Mytilinidion resinicola]|uniref:Actin-like ATPase domain-containing protein n=1 Tax=Mytilinidion resinicola TaxID=574789 RepID=A0A6A6Z0V4_9PEZI|nr:uncharacterized protein BDZ99DRAFT_437244 [Mytilinidion resinicola]KAF2814349.1 hypothetical protein BDZ99DRAFT_437244 [Mytilinidion resinicola]
MGDCLCIGIDFGTTFSGVAWAFSRRPEDIRIVTRWRADLAHNVDDAKAPTELVYGAGKLLLSWGYDINSNQTPIRWFKLLLADQRDLDAEVQNSPQLKQAREMLSVRNISAVDAAADYLRELWKHTIAEMEREFGKQAVKGLPFKVAVTFPAIWKLDARRRTEEAVRKAGILDPRLCGATTLVLVPEPEAAALATLAEFKGRPGVRPGDVFVVCDAGGGTVDLTSYKVQMTDPAVDVKEAVEPDGKMCGAIFVDQEFQNFLRGTLSPRRYDKMTPTQLKKVMNDEWEHGVKRGFDDSEREWEVRLPADAVKGGLFAGRRERESRAGLKLGRGHVRGIFQPVMNQIRGLVKKQVDEIRNKEGKKPKCIMLVGGFGRCSYLYKVFRTEYSNQDIEILQSSGNNPWTAICRGAVIKAMSSSGQSGPVTITSRISKCNYGLACYEPYRDGYHNSVDKIFLHTEGGYFADNQMRWYLRRGMDIETQQPLRFSFYNLYRYASEMPQNQLPVSILYSETRSATNRKETEVSCLCEIRIRLETPFDTLPLFFNKQGIEYRKMIYEVEMTSQDGLLKFSAYINGRRQGEQNVEVKYE